jgi:hypothetical protein
MGNSNSSTNNSTKNAARNHTNSKCIDISTDLNKLKCIYMKLAIYNAKQYWMSEEDDNITISEEERIENQNNLEHIQIMTLTPSMMLHVANLLKEEVNQNNNNINNPITNVDKSIQINLEETIDELETVAYNLNSKAVASSISASSSVKAPKIPLNSGAIAGIIIGSIVGLSLLVFIIYKIKSKKIYKFQPSNLNKNKKPRKKL